MNISRLKLAVFAICLLPFVYLLYAFFTHQLGANPYEELTRRSGEWTLRFLLLTLAMTPLRKLSGSTVPIRFRRMLGLYSFFYAVFHLLTYLWFDQFFDLAEIINDIIKRPYITLGMLAVLLMLPLAMTSTRGMIRKLGKKWQALHRLVYVIALLGVVHFMLLVKADILWPVFYGLVLAILLLFRLPVFTPARV